MNFIVAVDENWGIGKDNKLLTSIPEDIKFFRETTMDKVVVMGRKTLESLPGGLPLLKRTNIVISSDKNYTIDGAIVVHSIEEALEEIKKYKREDVFVIGGASIYKQMLPYCERGDIAYITKIYKTFDADAFFPKLDFYEWELMNESDEREYKGLKYKFHLYRKLFV